MKSLIIIAILICSNVAYSHGENAPGPHKGYIRMPGVFHTELVPVGVSKFKLYLLDMKWKNPSIKDSKLDAKIAADNKFSEIACTKNTHYYECLIPEGFSLKQGQLTISATRENSPGADMVYDLPLSFNLEKKVAPNADPSANAHSGHH